VEPLDVDVAEPVTETLLLSLLVAEEVTELVAVTLPDSLLLGVLERDPEFVMLLVSLPDAVEVSDAVAVTLLLPEVV
jgi:hypothetical protein